MRRIPLFGRLRRDWQVMYEVCRAADNLIQASESRQYFKTDEEWTKHTHAAVEALRACIRLLNDNSESKKDGKGEIVLTLPPPRLTLTPEPASAEKCSTCGAAYRWHTLEATRSMCPGFVPQVAVKP